MIELSNTLTAITGACGQASFDADSEVSACIEKVRARRASAGRWAGRDPRLPAPRVAALFWNRSRRSSLRPRGRRRAARAREPGPAAIDGTCSGVAGPPSA
jgi:hypothetical protein